MQLSTQLIHERTLYGAIDSYLSYTAHVQPHLTVVRRQCLEAMADLWVDIGGNNEIDAITPLWFIRYLFTLPSDTIARPTVEGFFAWARREKLL